MNIENLTIGEAREIARLFGAPAVAQPADMGAYAAFIGKPVFIRTVTHHFTGRLVSATAGELVIEEAAWIADSGRWSAALTTGALGEVEPYPAGPVVVSRGAAVDVCLWPHALPRGVK